LNDSLHLHFHQRSLDDMVESEPAKKSVKISVISEISGMGLTSPLHREGREGRNGFNDSLHLHFHQRSHR